MKQNVKDYLWDNFLMEFSLATLWILIIYVATQNDFYIFIDMKVFAGITLLGTIVWIIGFIHEVRRQ